MSLFAKKSLDALQREALQGGQGSLRRVLGPVGLVAMGVGVIVGAGLFSITGVVAANYAGPAVTVSFIIAAVCCAFAGLCYAEFASMIPIAGSAYTYSYATMGELLAWIIGWDLVLEYSVAATMVSISWSGYAVAFCNDLGFQLPPELTACPWDGGLINLPAMGLVVLISLLLIKGIKESATVNTLIVLLKVSVILVFVVLGWRYINQDNYTPFVPDNTGRFGEFGLSGILRGAAVVFFAFLGFDSVSTLAQETRNPRRYMPIGILGSLGVVLLLYIGFSYVMTGVANYTDFSGQNGIAPVAVAIAQMGDVGADGVVQPAFPWLNRAIMLAILIGYCSVVMVTLLAQSRIFLTMSRDGLLPAFFGRIHPRFGTPARNNLVFMAAVGLLAGFVPAELAGEMTSIGTLFAFILVCGGILVLRKRMPERTDHFRVPMVPLIPVLGIVTCLIVMLSLPAETWIRLVIWMLIGLDIYLAYGVRHSHLAGAQDKTTRRHGMNTFYYLGITVSVICCLTGLWHQCEVGWDKNYLLLAIALLCGLFHVVFYLYRLRQSPQVATKN